MPANTKNRNARITYLPEETDAEVVRQAKELDRSISWVIRELVEEALAWRKAGSGPTTEA